jgi:hypothetical protein
MGQVEEGNVNVTPNDIEIGKNTIFQARTGGKTRIVRPAQRATLLDVARGKMTMIGFLDHKTSSRRMGFHERSEQSNIDKMEKVCENCKYCSFPS